MVVATQNVHVGSVLPVSRLPPRCRVQPRRCRQSAAAGKVDVSYRPDEGTAGGDAACAAFSVPPLKFS